MTTARDVTRRLALSSAAFLLSITLSFFLVVTSAVAADQPTPSDTPNPVASACPPVGSTVETVRRIDREIEGSRSGLATDRVEMGDTIELSGSGLQDAATCGGPNKPLVLYVDGSPISGLQPFAISASALRFKIVRTEAAKLAWNRLLGRPQFSAIRYAVSTGFEDKGAFPSSAAIHLLALPEPNLMASFIGFLVLVLAFGLLATKTNLLRDGSVANGSAEKLSTAFRRRRRPGGSSSSSPPIS